MRSIVVTLMVAAAASAAPFVHAQTGQVVAGSAPGVAGVAQTVEITASITAIDAKTRAIMLKGPQGGERTVVAGPEVKNFAQLKVGDQVQVQYVEALVLELKKGSTAAPSITEKSGAKSAEPGAKPGAVAGRQVTVVGEVLETNAATQTVVVRGPQRTVELKVRDPEQFKLVAKGDRIEARYTEAAAIVVKPAAKK
ncbi:MAG TPA: hypothetical protein VFX05_00200 [Casimicrobiaceae bacterium]|nr:hypothetical protein [Casimicrobiaceae bacterium]